MLPEYEHEQKLAQSVEVDRPRHQTGPRPSTKNRGRLDTVAEIVNSCVGGANKSRVMLLANVNSIVATEMLEKLVTSGLVSAKRQGTSVAYSATEEGGEFILKYCRLVSMLCPGLVPPTRLNDDSGSGQAWI